MKSKCSSKLQVHTDASGRVAVEFPSQVQGTTIRVIAGTYKTDEARSGISTVVIEEGTGKGEQFRPTEAGFSITGMRAITDLITALHAVVHHAFGWQSPGPQQVSDN